MHTAQHEGSLRSLQLRPQGHNQRRIVRLRPLLLPDSQRGRRRGCYRSVRVTVAAFNYESARIHGCGRAVMQQLT